MTAGTIKLACLGLVAAFFVLSARTAWRLRETMRARLGLPKKELDEELAKWRTQRDWTRCIGVVRPGSRTS